MGVLQPGTRHRGRDTMQTILHRLLPDAVLPSPLYARLDALDALLWAERRTVLRVVGAEARWPARRGQGSPRSHGTREASALSSRRGLRPTASAWAPASTGDEHAKRRAIEPRERPGSMTAGTQTLAKLPSLAQLSQTGDRSPIVEATIEKLVAMERARLAHEVASLAERLRVFEERSQLASVDVSRRFQAGDIGDDADLCEWSAFSHLWVSALAHLMSLGHETTSWTPIVIWTPSSLRLPRVPL